MPKAEQVSEGKRHTKTQGEVLQIKTLHLGSKTLEPVRDLASKGQNQFVIYASFRETLLPTPKPTKAQQDTQKRQSFPDETHVLLKRRCVCEARFTPGRAARKNGPSPKETAGVRRNQRESEEKKNRDAHQHFQEVSSEEAS